MDVDGLNAGYASTILEQYLENPEAVPSEWRALFESGRQRRARKPARPRAAARARARRRQRRRQPRTATALPRSPRRRASRSAAPLPTTLLLGGVAAAMALVKAYRMHGHLAARLDPLGSEPVGDPALEPERLIPRLTPELQARIPASLLRLYVPAETLADALPRLRETYCGTIAYEIEHISDHERARLAAAGDRVGPLPPAAGARREAAAARAPDRGRGLRAVPAPRVPRPEAVLDRGPRRDDPDARRVDRARRPRPARTRS